MVGQAAWQGAFALYDTRDGVAHWSFMARIFGSAGPGAIAPAARPPRLWFADASCATPTTMFWTWSTRGVPWTRRNKTVVGPRVAEGSGPLATELVRGSQAPTLDTAYEAITPKGLPLSRYFLQVAPLAAGTPTVHTLPAEVPNADELIYLSFISVRAGWVETGVAPDALYQTTNGGRTWRRIATPGSRDASTPLIAQTSPTVGWYATGQRLWRTTTDGRTWVSIPLPLEGK